MKKNIVVFIPYYLSENHDRQVELDLCLEKNVQVEAIEKIFLLVDDGHIPDVKSEKITVIHTQKRPSYWDWVTLTNEHCNGEISVLANSDIYFDGSIAKMKELFNASDEAFLALSRYEVIGDTVELHKNPHWSQDVWAIDSANPVSQQIHDKLKIPLGVPRCDNKICYIFSVHGYDVFNPCTVVRSYHLHETQVRGYDMHVDKRILGGTAWVYPSADVLTPSELDYDVWSLKPGAVKATKTNGTIVRKEAQGLGGKKAAPISKAIVAYDSSWQFPAITEQHAYKMMCKRLDPAFNSEAIRYFAFPWATLIDNLLHNKKTPKKTDFLKSKLRSFKPKLENATRIVTTCQHIHMLKFQALFNDMGVTDIYWTHALTTGRVLPEFPHIKIHPFPLFPVQAVDAVLGEEDDRNILYSFIGAKANKHYLTDSRTIILEGLADDKEALIAGNDTWHYNKIVYDFQITGKSASADNMIDTDMSEKFREVLAKSIFSLCPSGTGPNSIRLWESIGFGSIPVIIADNLALPGDPKLWQEAAIFCPETKHDILDLPLRLRTIFKDKKRMQVKRKALAEIWRLYGADDFVHDIVEMISGFAKDRPVAIASHQPDMGRDTERGRGMMRAHPKTLSGNIVWLTSEALLSPERFNDIVSDENNRAEIQTALKQATEIQKGLFYQAIDLQGAKLCALPLELQQSA